MDHQIEMEPTKIFRYAKWWLDCSCGWFHGARTKTQAIEMCKNHLKKVAQPET